MLGGGLQLALIPAPLIAAAIIAFGFTPRHNRSARAVAGAGFIVAIVLLALEAHSVGAGRLEASLGTPVAGIDYRLRIDLPGAVLGLAALVVGLLLLLDGDRQTREVRALLMCVTGTVIAALAGNLVMLTAGVEIAGVGTLLMTSASRGRPGRGGVVAIGVAHVGSLGLLVAAVQLLNSSGTTDFTVVPAGAIGATVAGPWAAAGVTRLLATSFVPLRGSRTPTAAWAATGAIPCGAIVLLRLREGVGGPLPQGIAVALAAVGGLAAVWAAVLALRWSRVPGVAGRALCVVAAAPVVALSGVASPAADAAVAAGICSVMLVAALTPAWEHVGRGPAGRGLAALALSAAGSLPLGFGITAVILELAAAVSIGRAGAALVVSLGLAALIGAAAAVRSASSVVGAPSATTVQGARASALGVIAAVASLTGALVPGATATTLLSTLSPGGLTEPIGVAAIRSPGGDWAGGYLVVALILVAAAVWALTTLGERPLPISSSRELEAVAPAVQALGLRPARLMRPALIHAAGWLGRIDGWLVVQPQLAMVLGGAFLAIVFLH